MPKFIRFIRLKRVEGGNAREGFFCAAYELRSDSRLDDAAYDRLESLLGWFRANLPIPKKFNRTRSKGAQAREHTAGLSWFKQDASLAVGKSFELISLLTDHGYPIEVLRTERPGYIIYEDDQQVVAEPFSDTPV